MNTPTPQTDAADAEVERLDELRDRRITQPAAIWFDACVKGAISIVGLTIVNPAQDFR